MKPLSIYREILVDMTWEFGGATIFMKLLNTRETVESWTCFVLCAQQYMLVPFFLCRTHCGWHSVPRHVAGIHHARFRRRGSGWHTFPTRWSASTFPQRSDILNRKFPEKWNGRGGSITWLPRSPDLTPLASSFRGKLMMLCTCHKRCRNLLVVWEIQWQQLPSTCWTTFRLKLNTDIIFAGPLTVPSLNICKM
jgi:hypothetical protein